MRSLQINLTLDPELARKLAEFMRRQKLRKKATAVKNLLQEALETHSRGARLSELRTSLGCALAPRGPGKKEAMW